MNFVYKLIWIGAGGFFGAVSRFLLAGVFQKAAKVFWFPSGTLGVNILGCFLIGLLGGWVENRALFRPEIRSLLIIGFLGSFTTFSTFGYETLAFLRDQEFLFAGMNVLLHLVLGLTAVYIGYQITLS